ncbi:MAG: sugar phosphate isomerase/epimerase family protein [Candidatus Firestonebacteria bacterium]
MSMKFAAFSCMTPDWTAEQVCIKLKELGYDGVEWTVGYQNALWDKTKEWHLSEINIEEEATKLKELCKKYNLKICSLATRVSCKEPERFERVVKAATILDCSMLRVNVPRYDLKTNYSNLYKDTIESLKKIEKICKTYKVRGLLEIHMGTIIPSPSAVMRIAEKFNPEYIGVTFDPGNMVHEGYERWQMGIEILGKYLSHVHVKNCGWFFKKVKGKKKWVCEPMSLKDGFANYEEIIQGLKNVGYNGWISFEDFRGGYCSYPVGITTEEKLKEDLLYLKKMV